VSGEIARDGNAAANAVPTGYDAKEPRKDYRVARTLA
jgi:hypothetical protein